MGQKIAKGIVLLGGLQQNKVILHAFKLIEKIELRGVFDPESQSKTIHVDSGEVPIYTKIEDMVGSQLQYDLIIDTLDRPDLVGSLNVDKQPVVIINKTQISFCFPFMQALVEAKQELRWTNEVMEAAQEGIQVVDAEGMILYANASFQRILNVPLEKRIGKNVFDVSPDGSLAYVLKTGKPVFGNTHTTNGVPIIANASPIINEGKVVGAVTVFNDASSIEKLAQILQKNREEIDSLRAEIRKMNRPRYCFLDLVGDSQAFQNCLRQAKQAADSYSTVLITGESGTGKELFAHSIHEFGQRKKEPFIKVNCPAIPGTLLESELFGYEKGAFTGATKAKIGKFELANGGTIFLDEIGDLDLILQAKLLRVLQEREVERIGGSRTIQVDVRVIAATNQNLHELIEKGLFRKDLFYRLNVIHIHIPPLRERLEDVPMLAVQIMDKLYEKNRSKKYSYARMVPDQNSISADQGNGMGINAPKIDKHGLVELCNYNWPGNVRELENLIEKLMIFSDGRIITKEDVIYGLYADEKVQLADVTCQSIAAMEKRMILAALDRHGMDLNGKKTAAKELGISLTCLYDKLKKYSVN